MNSTRQHTAIHLWLLPLSWIYGAVVWLRNRLFDLGVLPQRSFRVPTICIGNLAVGGTGKTPMTEYLIRLLTGEGLHVATLSRGYGRSTRGFRIVTADSTAAEAGDEPRQMKRKFPDITVAVCEDRCHGIGQLLATGNRQTDVILLDDAFQHRYVRAGLNIVLTDCSRLYSRDALLPAGRLRESRSGAGRAQMVVVTKCPDRMQEHERQGIRNELKLNVGQQLYFSRIKYDGEVRARDILLLTGIADPTPLEQHLRATGARVHTLRFPDHHRFSDKDLRLIARTFRNIDSSDKLIVTTEKDAQRLADVWSTTPPDIDADSIMTLPISMEITGGEQETFNKNILSYVRENSRNSSIPESENDHQS